MCGIAGLIAPVGGEEARARLEAMLALIGYRGPDDVAGAAGEGYAIGAARLAIVDLHSGAQPAVSPDGRVLVAFNGEIFNYRELRAGLSARGHVFRTHSEVEVLLTLYREYGVGMASMLNGQFALAIWDAGARSLHLARDPFGIRPLFWWAQGDSVFFASEIKSLLANPEVPAALDPRGLLQTLRFWTVTGERTLFSQIRQLPAGHTLSWRSGSVRLERYWSWPFSDSLEPLGLTGDAEYCEAFKEAFAGSVRRQSMADVEVGALVSGGIDSSVIVHHLARQDTQASATSTFSVAFDDAEYDESGAQLAVTRHYGTRHHVTRVAAADIAQAFPEAVLHAETALFRSAPVPMYQLYKAIRAERLKVVMSGEGADEILLGYDLFREVKIRRFWARRPDSRWRGQLLRRLYGYLPQFRSARFFGLMLDFYRPTLVGAPGEDAHYAMAVRWSNGKALEACLSRGLHDELRTYDPCAELEAWLPPGYAAADDVERAQSLEVMTLLGNYLLSSQGDRMAMANSVETRYPYLDLEFVRFAARLPRRLKLRGLKDKYILRHAYAGVLPEAIRSREKFAYQAPEKKAFFPHGRLVPWAADLLTRERIIGDGLFDPDYVARYCLAAPQRESGRQGFRGNMLFMVVLSTTLLADAFLRRRASMVADARLPRPFRALEQPSPSGVRAVGP